MSHTFYRPHKSHKPKKNANHVLDMMVYPLAFIAPIMTIPQIADIWMHKNVTGISLLTWSSYVVVSAFWFIYGLHHKEKPLILGNILLIVVNSLVVLGVLLYR